MNPRRPHLPSSGDIATVLRSLGILAAWTFSQQLTALPLISLDYSVEVSTSQKSVFDAAAGFWNSTITGYHLQTDYLGQYRPHGLTISVSVPSIDGVNGILGSAGPLTATYYDDNPYGTPTVALWYATTGAMEFDSADVDAMIASNTFYGVVLHEMAHVLGVGTLWTYNTDLNGTIYDLYTTGSGQYLGTNALAQWRDEFGRPDDDFVPVELGGGAGTADGHWDEIDNGAALTGIVSQDTGLDLAYELMTGWASGTFFISRATLGAIDDLGYSVDYSKAGIVDSAFTIPEFRAMALLSASGTILLLRRKRHPRQ